MLYSHCTTHYSGCIGRIDIAVTVVIRELTLFAAEADKAHSMAHNESNIVHIYAAVHIYIAKLIFAAAGIAGHVDIVEIATVLVTIDAAILAIDPCKGVAAGGCRRIGHSGPRNGAGDIGLLDIVYPKEELIIVGFTAYAPIEAHCVAGIHIDR